MSDTPKKHGTERPEVGRKWAGEPFPTVKTAEQVAAERVAQEPYNTPDAVDLITYFSIRRISDPVKRAGMAAYTTIRNASVAAFDDIFSTY
jgi:hypothetical protein